MDAPCHSRCGTLKNPLCSKTMSAEHRSKFAALHRQWWRLYMSIKFSSETKNHKQTKNNSRRRYMIGILPIRRKNYVTINHSNCHRRNFYSSTISDYCTEIQHLIWFYPLLRGAFGRRFTTQRFAVRKLFPTFVNLLSPAAIQ